MEDEENKEIKNSLNNPSMEFQVFPCFLCRIGNNFIYIHFTSFKDLSNISLTEGIDSIQFNWFNSIQFVSV